MSVGKIKGFLKPGRVGWLIARTEIDKLNKVMMLFGLDFESFHFDEGFDCIIEFIVVKNEGNGFGKIIFRLPSDWIIKKLPCKHVRLKGILFFLDLFCGLDRAQCVDSDSLGIDLIEKTGFVLARGLFVVVWLARKALFLRWIHNRNRNSKRWVGKKFINREVILSKFIYFNYLYASFIVYLCFVYCLFIYIRLYKNQIIIRLYQCFNKKI
jgi:hypothetical protein